MHSVNARPNTQEYACFYLDRVHYHHSAHRSCSFHGMVQPHRRGSICSDHLLVRLVSITISILFTSIFFLLMCTSIQRHHLPPLRAHKYRPIFLHTQDPPSPLHNTKIPHLEPSSYLISNYHSFIQWWRRSLLCSLSLRRRICGLRCFRVIDLCRCLQH